MTAVSWLLQTALAAGACIALWLLLQRTRGGGAIAYALAVAGFLLRAVAAQLFFWISWIPLPLGSSLQIGNGLWFFAYDGWTYLDLAERLIASGWQQGVAFDSRFASPVFVWALAIATLLFGSSAMTGVLLNLLAHAASCALIVRIAGRSERLLSPANIAIGALSLSPAIILWSLQPLKDPLFFSLTVAFFAAVIAGQRRWLRESAAERRAAGLLSALVAAAVFLYAIAGIRWYAAVALLAATVPFVVLLMLASPGRRLATLGAGCFTILLFSQVVVTAAGPALPPSISNILRPFGEHAGAGTDGLMTESLLDPVRRSFERLSPSSEIRLGEAIAPAPSPRPASGSRRWLENVSAGTLAALLPQFVARPLGLIEAGGNRAMMAFADLDTLVFVALLAIAIRAAAPSLRRGGWRNPALWLLGVATVAVAVAIAYTVNNVGAMIRYRSMVFTGLAILPLIAADWLRAKDGAR